MRFNFPKTDTILTTIRGHSYPVERVGKGIPCLMLCLGTPSLRTVSSHFAEMFEIYSSDMYWVKNSPHPDERLTLDIVLDDIKSLIDALKLDKCVIFAHSAYGIIALEFAKKYPDIAKGIIMVGTPVNCNSSVGINNQRIFEFEADHHRKMIDTNNRETFQQINKQSFSSEQLFLWEYIYRDAARYWYQPEFDCVELWKGIELSPRFIELFSRILPSIDVLKNLEIIKTPIFLAAGLYDFDCCPWLWEEVENLPAYFKVERFERSGHWPQCEESQLFDQSVGVWVGEFLTL